MGACPDRQLTGTNSPGATPCEVVGSSLWEPKQGICAPPGLSRLPPRPTLLLAQSFLHPHGQPQTRGLPLLSATLPPAQMSNPAHTEPLRTPHFPVRTHGPPLLVSPWGCALDSSWNTTPQEALPPSPALLLWQLCHQKSGPHRRAQSPQGTHCRAWSCCAVIPQVGLAALAKCAA